MKTVALNLYILLVLTPSCAHVPDFDQRALAFEEACVNEQDIASCQVCTELTSELPACWNGLGLAQTEAEDYESAMSFFVLALQADPTYVQAYNNIGVIMYNTGNTEQAIRYFQEALRLDPLYKEALSNLKKAKGE